MALASSTLKNRTMILLWASLASIITSLIICLILSEQSMSYVLLSMLSLIMIVLSSGITLESNTIEAVLDKVRHMHALGCKYIVLDHLSIVVSDQSGDERKQLDEISTKLKTLCMNLNIALIVVIHQNRQGQIRGTAGVEQLSNIVLKLYRDNTDPNPWRRNVTKIMVEKNRFCGRTGPACYLWYNEMTGRLEELTPEEVETYESGDNLRDDARAF
jgi:replicative DNA helicase